MKRRSLGKQRHSPSPYQKKQKQPYAYSAGYREWKRKVMSGAGTLVQQREGSRP